MEPTNYYSKKGTQKENEKMDMLILLDRFWCSTDGLAGFCCVVIDFIGIFTAKNHASFIEAQCPKIFRLFKKI